MKTIYEERKHRTTTSEREAFAVPRRVIDEHRQALREAFGVDDTDDGLNNPEHGIATMPGEEVRMGKVIRMPIEFDTTEYEFSHGNKPRGCGSWAFAFGKRNAAPWFAETTIQGVRVTSMTYAEAKKVARAEARKRGAVVVYVCS